MLDDDLLLFFEDCFSAPPVSVSKFVERIKFLSGEKFLNELSRNALPEDLMSVAQKVEEQLHEIHVENIRTRDPRDAEKTLSLSERVILEDNIEYYEYLREEFVDNLDDNLVDDIQFMYAEGKLSRWLENPLIVESIASSVDWDASFDWIKKLCIAVDDVAELKGILKVLSSKTEYFPIVTDVLHPDMTDEQKRIAFSCYFDNGLVSQRDLLKLTESQLDAQTIKDARVILKIITQNASQFIGLPVVRTLSPTSCVTEVVSHESLQEELLRAGTNSSQKRL